MKQEYYRQCSFQSDNSRCVAWIEESGAEVGKLVQFKEDADTDKWWEVLSVSENRITKAQAQALERRNLKFQQSLK